MRKISTVLLEQGTQTPSPAPDLIPAETKNQPRTHIGIGTANGGTSQRPLPISVGSTINRHTSQQVPGRLSGFLCALQHRCLKASNWETSSQLTKNRDCTQNPPAEF
jgi:hypothetical protein